MKKEGIQTRNRKISTKLKKAQKDQRLDSNFRFLDRSGLPWGGYGMPGGFHPGFPGSAAAAAAVGAHHHSATAAAMAASSYASQVGLPPPPMAHGTSGTPLSAPSRRQFPRASPGSASIPAAFGSLNSGSNPSTMAFGWLPDGVGQFSST